MREVSVLARLGELVDRLPGDRVLVAVDGPDAAGKTTFARELSGHLARPALCASVDGWHFPREVRLRRGPESPEGYYRDSFDVDALVRDLLAPFRAGAPQVQTARYDVRSETPAPLEQQVPERAALLVDGVFLLRPPLLAHWDLRVHLHVPPEVTLARALVRDRDLLGGEDAVRRRYLRRYLPGQQLYREEAAPQRVADVVLDTSHPREPGVLRWPAGRRRA